MTIHELLDKHNIKYEKLKADKGINLFKVGNTNVLFWINDGNAFKMKRNWFELLEDNCEKYALFLYDKKGKQYYYIKFLNKNNWLSGSFGNCDKSELFLGKQVLNSPSTIGNILTDLKKCST